MEKNEKLNDLLKQVVEIVPTMLFIGTTADKQGALLMCSPEKTSERRKIDLTATIAMIMDARAECHEVILSGVCYYLQQNPEYQEKMREALDKMKEFTNTAKVNVHLSPEEAEDIKKRLFDGHQRTAEPE